MKEEEGYKIILEQILNQNCMMNENVQLMNRDLKNELSEIRVDLKDFYDELKKLDKFIGENKIYIQKNKNDIQILFERFKKFKEKFNASQIDISKLNSLSDDLKDEKIIDFIQQIKITLKNIKVTIASIIIMIGVISTLIAIYLNTKGVFKP